MCRRFFQACPNSLAWVWLLLAAPVAGAAEMTLSIADISGPDFSAQGVALVLPQDGSADLRIKELHVRQHSLRDVHVRCASFALSTAGIRCDGGSLARLRGVTVDLDYRFDTRNWQVAARLDHAAAGQFSAFLPSAPPLSVQGELHGALHIRGAASGVVALDADVRLADGAFSDASGLHAAEKLNATVSVSAARKAAGWDWRGEIAWESGELFWNPLYLRSGGCDTLPAQSDGSAAPCRGGYTLVASGSLEGTSLKIDRAALDLPQAGRVRLAALWDMERGVLAEGTARGENLALNKVFADFAKPFLDKGALAESQVYGHADVDWHYRGGKTQALRVTLREVGIADAERRFALLGMNGDIDWRADAPGAASIAFGGGALLGVPLGSGRWQVAMHGMEFGVARAVLPVLDGELELRDFHLRRENDKWHWQFAASLGKISMEQFSQAAGWPKMLGTLAGSIPRVSYDGGTIKVEGALLFNVFDGSVAVTGLELADPFGRAPRLIGNLSMRELDLDLLTRTFSFGNMQGRIDVDVKGLELQNWQPARFDARLASSAGNYPRKISQTAVQNISALGGAGAAAAIQRSYLRFFENFGYDKIGWRCTLRNGVCAMGGVEEGGATGAYVIVKGGGIPAITVMGYNRSVSWGELITRLKRVTQGNMQAVVK